MTAKYADGGSVFGKLMSDPMFWGPTVAMGAGVVATGLASAYQRVKDTRAQAEAYKTMLDLHPQLKSNKDIDVRRVYTSLHNVNPMMARDPLVAGAWINTIAESAGVAGNSGQALLEGIKDLAQIRSHISGSRKSEGGGMPEALGAGVERFLGGAIVSARENLKEYGETAVLKKRMESEKTKALMGDFHDKIRELGDQQAALRAATEGASRVSANPRGDFYRGATGPGLGFHHANPEEGMAGTRENIRRGPYTSPEDAAEILMKGIRRGKTAALLTKYAR